MPTKRGNSEGSITKRKDGIWQAAITIEEGKRKYFYAKTRQEAARKLAEALRDRDKGVLIVTDTRQTLGAYLATWLEATKATIRLRTWQRYEQYVRVHIVPSLGTTSLAKLTAQQVQALYTAKLAEGLSTTTVNHLHQVLHRALDAALRLDLVVRNVCERIDPPRMRHHEMTTLSEEQAHTLLVAAEGDRFETLYVLALATGMRQGELLALRWRDVDLDGGTLQVRATLQNITGGFVFAEPKTAHSRRRIALSRTAIAALKRHRLRQAEERLRLGPAWQEMDLVFPNSIGKPMDGLHLLQRNFSIHCWRRPDCLACAFTICVIQQPHCCWVVASTQRLFQRCWATRRSGLRSICTAISLRTCSSRQLMRWMRHSVDIDLVPKRIDVDCFPLLSSRCIFCFACSLPAR